jgi:hypothetical protein
MVTQAGEILVLVTMATGEILILVTLTTMATLPGKMLTLVTKVTMVIPGDEVPIGYNSCYGYDKG